MSGYRVSQVSFTRGELTPALYERTDIEQYSIGLKTLKNGFIHQEGCVSNRPGLEFVNETKFSASKATRLLPFIFNTEQTYIIEAGDKYFRFYQDGGIIVYPDDYGVTYDGAYEYKESGTGTGGTYYKYELDNGDFIYSSKNAGSIAVGDTVYADEDLSEKYTKGSSYTSKEGEITSLDRTNGKIKIDEDAAKIAIRGEIVELETPYLEEDLPLLKYAQSADILTITHSDYPPKQLARYDHHDWKLSDIVFEPSIAAPVNVTATWHGGTSSDTRTYTYLVTAVDDETGEESERSAEVSVVGHREAYWTTSEYMTISWSAVTGASEYNVYRSTNGVFGYSGTCRGTTFTDDKIEPDLTSTAPLYKNPFENGNNPATCAYYQQRKIYANTLKKPQTIYASRTASSDNFDYSRPLVATDSVEITLADREVNEIRHLVPLRDLIALTSNTEYRINGSDGTFSANPAPVAVVQSCYGASHVQPIISGEMVLYVQSAGNIIRDLGYDYLSDAYTGDELTLLSSHLFRSKEILYIAYAKEPYRLVYVILNDGTLAVLTYNKKQKLCGWARYETKGVYESVATVREGMEDVAYFVVLRNINGTLKRYIERTQTRIISDCKKAFMLDSALYAHFDTEVTSVSGLNHLAGMKISVLADGGVMTDLTVSDDGVVNLPKKTSDIVAGLPYEFELETLGIESDQTHGLKKVINSVYINILNSREDFWICGNQGAEIQNPRSLESINDSGYLYSGCLRATPLNTATDKATVHIKQPFPLPLTISSISAEVDVGI